MFNLITHKINNERSGYLYTHFLLETDGAAPVFIQVMRRVEQLRAAEFVRIDRKIHRVLRFS